MQNFTLKQKFAIAWYTLKNMWKNIAMYAHHSKDTAKREVRDAEYRTIPGKQLDPTNYEICCPVVETEDGEIYVPSHSIITVQGDGFDMVLENHSRFNRTVYWSVKSETETQRYTNAPPTFDEGEDNGN